MNSLNISTTVKAFKELLVIDNDPRLIERLKDLDDIQSHFELKDFKTALQLEKGLSFSFHKGEEKAQKEFQYILKNQILTAYIHHLESEVSEFNSMALSLLPHTFKTQGLFTEEKLIKDVGGLNATMKRISTEHHALKEAIIHLFDLSLKRTAAIKLLKKDLAEIQHD
jgi:hypothetical protein